MFHGGAVHELAEGGPPDVATGCVFRASWSSRTPTAASTSRGAPRGARRGRATEAARGASRPRPSEPCAGDDKASVHRRAPPRPAGARGARAVQLVRDLRARGARPPEGHHTVKHRPLRHVLHEPTAPRRAPAVGQGSRRGAVSSRVLERPPHTLTRSRLHALDAGPKSGEPPHRITAPGERERLALVELHGRASHGQRSSHAARASASTSDCFRLCSNA